MRCRECTADLPAEARFCHSCGTRVEPSVPERHIDPIRDALEKAIGFQYRIERQLGRGGMGAVYLAHELALDRDVAIKVLPPDLASTPELRERFTREARTAARLTHPNIVPLLTFGEVSGLMYFVMGYVAGESLASRLRQGPLDVESARALIVALCDALAYAHQQGVVHRDIKPDNILIESGSGTPRLTDFGIAKTMLSDSQMTTAQLTTAGQLVGTPDYMSPEQAKGEPDIGTASDIYSLGVVGYEILSGRRPFEGTSPMDILAQRILGNPRPLGEVAPRVPPDLAQPIMRCLERDPAKRWPDARSLREALMPPEDAVEYSPPVRVLKAMTTVVVPIGVLAFLHLWLFEALNPGVTIVARARSVFVPAFIGVAVVVFGTFVRLRREGLGARTIVLKVLEQPTWWRSWYPRSLRRSGDVWDRLPPAIRRLRTLKALLLAYVFAVFLPLLTLYSWRFPFIKWPLFLVAAAGIAVMLASRQAIGNEIRRRTALTPPEVSMLLNTPTWRTSMWRNRPGSLILAGSKAQPPFGQPE